MLTLAGCAGTFGGAAVASPFDTCVLQHMQGVTSDVAAVSVKEACLHTTETPLPDSALQTLMTMQAGYGKLPSPEGGQGLYVSINNNSGYTITELVLQIEDKRTHETERYVVRVFPSPPPPGAIALGYGPDRTLAMMIAPGGDSSTSISIRACAIRRNGPTLTNGASCPRRVFAD